MKRNSPVSLVTAILLIVALFIPTYIAIGAYIAGPNSEYVKKQSEVSELTLTDINGKSYVFRRGTNTENMIDIFESIINNATKVSALSDTVRSQSAFGIKMKTGKATSAYRFYFDIDGTSYFEDSIGNAFGVEKEHCAAFYKTEYAACLYDSNVAPKLRNAYGNVILPSEMLWQYKNYGGEYQNALVDTVSSMQNIELDGAFTLSFDIEPDFSKVTLYSAETVVYDGVLSELKNSVTVKSNTTYKMVIEAKWYEDASRDYKGEAKYTFMCDVSAPASFTLGQNSVQAGQIAVINASNVKDISLIKIKFTPSLTYQLENITPVFCGSGSSYSALIPIPASCFADTAQDSGVLKYHIDIEYGDATYTLNLDVTDRNESRPKAANASKADISAHYTEQNIADFRALVLDASAKSSNEKLWKNDKFFSYYADGYGFALAFGKTWQLTDTIKYDNDFIDYKMRVGSDIYAVNDGKVVAVGESDYVGKYICIDHGMGLQSWYMHLSDISVSVGDKVSYKQTVAKSGSTGFLAHSNIGFSMMYTVYGVPVCPYSLTEGKGAYGLEETGLNLVAFKNN